MIHANPNPFMQQALEKAQQAVAHGEVPVGAVLVREGKVIASAHNLTRTQTDPTAHAELLVIRSACEMIKSSRLPDCDLYVTLEPCAMCAAAISFARIRRLYYGASDPKGGGVEYGTRFFSQPTCHHRPEIYGGLSASESGVLLREFFTKKR